MDKRVLYPKWMPKRVIQKDEVSRASNTTMVLARNLDALMTAHPELDSNPKLAKKTGLGTGTISRMRNGGVDPNLATVEALATAFHLEPWQLLVPVMDPASPPTLQRLSEQERRLYDRLREVAKEIRGDQE